jgi:hypothetical protein
MTDPQICPAEYADGSICGEKYETPRAFAAHWRFTEDDAHTGDPPDEMETSYSAPEATEAARSEEVQAKKRQTMSDLWEDEEYQERVKTGMREKWGDDDFRRAVSDGVSETVEELWEEGEYREKVVEGLSERMKEKWEAGDYDEALRGEFHQRYRGGEYDRGPLSREERERIREELDRECQLAGQSECSTEDRALQVAHIDGDVENNDPGNITTLCVRHHIGLDFGDLTADEITRTLGDVVDTVPQP